MANLQRVKQLFYLRGGQMDRDQVSFACGVLQKSGVIALPTDTLYGLAAKANDSKALEKIYKIKGRDPKKPLAVCVANVDAIAEVADIGSTNMNVIKSLLPGPVTLIFERSSTLNKDLNPGTNTIGVRIPCHNFIIALCDQVGPLALTSANRSGETSPIAIEDFKDLWADIDCIFDKESAIQNASSESVTLKPNRSGSTVIDFSQEDKKYYKIIREGCALNRSINILTRFGYRRRH